MALMVGAGRAKMNPLGGGTLGGLAPIFSMFLAGEEVSGSFLLGMAGESETLVSSEEKWSLWFKEEGAYIHARWCTAVVERNGMAGSLL
jgi:hypothetical protein